MYTIGIIEQDKALGDAMEQVLDEKGYFTVRADSLADVGELFQQVIVDMVVLDLEQKEFAGKEDAAQNGRIPSSPWCRQSHCY